MNWYSEDDKLLRRYLLNDVTAEERRLVEGRLLNDGDVQTAEEEPDFVDRLLLAEDELIDDHALGALSERERVLFDSNFAINSERRQKLIIAEGVVAQAAADMELRSLNRDREQVDSQAERSEGDTSIDVKIEWLHRLFFPSWKIVVYATITLALGLGIWRLFKSEPDLVRARKEIRQVYSFKRPLEIRISGYEYAMFPKTLGEEQGGFDYVALDRAERFLLDELAKQPTVETQHELGRLYLARKKFDQAEAILQLALQAEPNNASLHADLGAVFFEKWERQRSARSTSGQSGEQNTESDGLKQRSINHLTKALSLDGSLREARFNLALLYQTSNQIPQALEEWEKYLKDDPASPWAEEAERNLRMLK